MIYFELKNKKGNVICYGKQDFNNVALDLTYNGIDYHYIVNMDTLEKIMERFKFLHIEYI